MSKSRSKGTEGNTRTFRVEALARIEGEGGLHLEMVDGKCVSARVDIYEPPRFYEAFLRGRDFREVPDITARICGICPVAYQSSSSHALEKAMGIFNEIDPGIRALRDLIYCGEWIESHVLQAFVSEGIKPFVDTVITFGAGHFYVSQSDKGGLVFGGDIDGYNSYAQRGNLATVEHVAEAGVALIPSLSRLKVLRSWGGVMDMSMDGSPIIDRMPVEGLYLNAGWCYGGFKATPASGYAFAHLLANDAPHETATAYRLDRFQRGYVIDEKGVGAQPNLH